MKRKILSLVLALSLCFAMYTGGTMAYLTNESDIKTNVFTWDDSTGEDGSGKVRIELAEPNWDGSAGYQFVGVTKSSVDAKYTKYGFGKTVATKVAPGYPMPKDPTVKMNTAVETYVGIKVSAPSIGWDKWDYLFEMRAINTDGTVGAVGINGAAGQWVLSKNNADKDSPRYYIYQTKLTPTSAASRITAVPLFDSVMVKTAITEKELTERLPANKATFELKIQAFGVQANVPADPLWTNANYAVKAAFPEFA